MDEDVIHVGDEKPREKTAQEAKAAFEAEEEAEKTTKAEATEEAAEQRISSSLRIERKK